MIGEISRILAGFRFWFTRAAAFNWFVAVVFGFIVRIDLCRTSSFVRWLGIEPALYTAMLSFFRASSWRLGEILRRWWRMVLDCCPLPQLDGRLLLAGDGIKVSIATLMATMAGGLVATMGKRCLLVLDAYLAVGPVFAILKTVVDLGGRRLVHTVTRAKSNVVAYGEPPDKPGKPGRPRRYSD